MFSSMQGLRSYVPIEQELQQVLRSSEEYKPDEEGEGLGVARLEQRIGRIGRKGQVQAKSAAPS